MPEELVSELEKLCCQEYQDIKNDPKHKDEYIRLLSTYREIKEIIQGPAYWSSSYTPISNPPAAITLENQELLSGGLEDRYIQYRQPYMAALAGNRAVSVCSSVRITPLVHEAGVETLEAYRGQGFAANAVAGWKNKLLDMDIIPMYSTSWDNKASQKVAEKLDFSFYGTDFSII